MALIEFLFEVIERLLDLLAHQHQPPPSGTPVTLALLTDRTGADVPVQIRDNQQAHYVLSETDAAGNAVSGGPDTGTPAWSLDGDTIARLEISDDGLQGNVIALGPLGDAVLTVTVQVGTDDAGNPQLIQGSDVVSVIGDDVIAAIVLTPDQVTDQSPVVEPPTT